MDQQIIMNQINQINDFYSHLKYGRITAKELMNFTLPSIISFKKCRNNFFISSLRAQLNIINKCKYVHAFDDLFTNKNAFVINVIKKEYTQIRHKINVINTYLGTDINEPYVEDLYSFSRSDSKLDKLLSCYRNLNRGNRGEKYTWDSNKFEGDPVIPDVNIPDKYSKYFHSSRPNSQIDLTMINKWGIFLLEVKHYSAPIFEIGHNGQIITKDNRGHYRRRMNIVEQITRHETTMRHFLHDNGLQGINVQSIIICANKYAKVRSYCPNTHIFFPQTFYHGFIEDPKNHQNYRPMKRSQVKSIYNLLSKYSGHDETFLRPLFNHNYIEVFFKLIDYEREINALYSLSIKVKQLMS